MKLWLPAIQRAVPSFNKLPHTEDDFWRICRNQRPYVRVHQIPLGTPGFYMVEANGRPHIYLNSRLRGMEWLDSAFHELGHHLMHMPKTSRAAYYYRLDPPTKEEHEAQAFADIMLIPQSLMFEFLQSHEYLEDWGFAERILQGRCELYSRYTV